jgi:hypothetical protein
VTIGLVSVVITAFAHAAWFGIVWMFMRMSQGHPELSASEVRPGGDLRVPEAVANVGSELPSRHAGHAPL